MKIVDIVIKGNDEKTNKNVGFEIKDRLYRLGYTPSLSYGNKLESFSGSSEHRNGVVRIEVLPVETDLK